MIDLADSCFKGVKIRNQDEIKIKIKIKKPYLTSLIV